MRSFVKVFPVGLWVVLSVCGCGEERCMPSLIHPHTPGKLFQESSVDLSYYKPVQERPGQDANIVFAVAASGGGYRAANFATGVLLGLEELKIRIRLLATRCRRSIIFPVFLAGALQ